MAKEVQLFNGKAIPAHIAARMAEAPANIEDRISIPTLSTQGKGAWAITLNGETTRLQKRDADGDLIDMPIFRGIILDYAKRRGRAYYPGAYDADKPGKPACWSHDGITRDPKVAEPPVTEDGEIVTKCGNCPYAVKGSKVNELGKATTACAEHRIVVIVPHNQPDFTALRLKLSITSDYDGRSPELEAEDWFAFSNYTSAMRARGVTNTAFVVTKMRFDPNVVYPKVIFQWAGWVDELGEGIQDKILERATSDEVQNLLNNSWGEDAGLPTNGDAPAAKGKTPDADPPKTKKPPPPDADDDVPAPKTKKAPPPDDDDTPAPKAKKAPPPDDDDAPAPKAKKAPPPDDDDAPAPKAKATTKPATAPKKEAPPISAQQKSLMSKWSDDDDD